MQYDNTLKLEALKLSDEILTTHSLISVTSENMKVNRPFVGSGNKQEPTDEKDQRIQELEAELREAKLANELLKDALGFFAES